MSGDTFFSDPVVPDVPPSPEEEMAAKLFGDMKKPEPPPLPADATPAEKLFGSSQTHDVAQRAIAGAFVEHDGITLEEAQTAASEYSTVFSAAGLSNTVSQQIAEVGIAVALRPPSSEEVARWEEDAQGALRADFGGPEGAGQALADARRLVEKLSATHPHIKAELDRGAGSHPIVVRAVARAARELRKAGRL